MMCLQGQGWGGVCMCMCVCAHACVCCGPASPEVPGPTLPGLVANASASPARDCPGGGRARGSLNSQPLQVTPKSNACSLNSCGIRCKDGGVVVRGSGCKKG